MMRYLQALIVVLLPVLTVSAVTIMPTLSLAQSANAECSGVAKQVWLNSKPKLVNPGGKCRMRITLVHELTSRTDKMPDICVTARVAGSDKDYGPFCGDTPIQTPGPIEYLATSRPLTAWIKLCDPTKGRCF